MQYTFIFKMSVCLCYMCHKRKTASSIFVQEIYFAQILLRVWVHFIAFCIQVSQILNRKKCTSPVPAAHSCNENSHAYTICTSHF